MAGRKLNTQVRQEQIARAALDIVAAGGPGALSMVKVARRLGLVPSAIYRHFKSKDRMLEAALALVGRRLLANVEAACRRSTDPLERLRDLLARHMGMIRENLALPRAVFSEDVYGAHPRRKTLARKMIQGYLARVARVVRQGQREGGIRRDLDPDAAAILFLGMIQPAAILWHMTDGDFDVAGHARKVWRIFGRAIQQEPGRRRARRPRVISPPISRRRRSTSSISTRQGAA